MNTLTCKICNKTYYDKHLISHLKLYHYSDIKELYRYYLKEYKNIEIDKIIEEFNNGECVDQLRFKYNISNLRSILKIFNCYRTASESKHLLSYQNRHKNTIFQKYGVENISQSKEIKEKKKNTFVNHFGYENNFCNQDIHNKAFQKITERTPEQKQISQTKYENTLKEKYGPNIINVAQIPEVRNKISKTKKDLYKNMSLQEKQNMTFKARKACNQMCLDKRSSLEINLERILKNKNIIFKSNQYIGNYNCDFVFEKKKIIIEIYGDLFHANPLKYKETDYIPIVNKTAKMMWQKDQEKEKYVCNLGYKYVILWETDITRKSDEELIKILKEKDILK